MKVTLNPVIVIDVKHEYGSEIVLRLNGAGDSVEFVVKNPYTSWGYLSFPVHRLDDVIEGLTILKSKFHFPKPTEQSDA